MALSIVLATDFLATSLVKRTCRACIFCTTQRVVIQDLVRGEVCWDATATVGDFILLRSNGVPVYNFCVAGENGPIPRKFWQRVTCPSLWLLVCSFITQGICAVKLVGCAPGLCHLLAGSQFLHLYDVDLKDAPLLPCDANKWTTL